MEIANYGKMGTGGENAHFTVFKALFPVMSRAHTEANCRLAPFVLGWNLLSVLGAEYKKVGINRTGQNNPESKALKLAYLKNVSGYFPCGKVAPPPARAAIFCYSCLKFRIRILFPVRGKEKERGAKSENFALMLLILKVKAKNSCTPQSLLLLWCDFLFSCTSSTFILYV